MVDWHVPAIVSLVTTFLILCHGIYREVRIRRECQLKMKRTQERERMVADNPILRKLAETIAKVNNPFAEINATLHRIQATAVPTDIDLPLADEWAYVPGENFEVFVEPATFIRHCDYPTRCPACKATMFHTPESREYMRKHGYCSPKCGYRPGPTAPAVPTLPG